MGLDMYLIRRKYIGGNFEHNKIKGEINIESNGIKIPIDLNKITYIEEEVGYWRKANEVHKWFVDNVQNGVDDCSSYEVSTEKLQELLDICKKIKDTVILEDGKIYNGESLKDGQWIKIYDGEKVVKNPEICEELLPTQNGFFFGHYDYDEYYMEDIDSTIEILTRVIEEEKELDKKHVYSYLEYHSSW